MIAQIDSNYWHTSPRRVVPRLVSYAFFEGRPATTRGRWVNPALFALFAGIRHLPITRAIDRPIFVVGMGRSGTTVLGVTLSMHRDVGFLNEPKALWHAIHPEEDVIGSYSRGPARYRLRADDATPEVITAAHRLFGAYLGITRHRRLVDKYPELVFRVPFVRRIFPDARFLFVTRNGWDACASIDTWSQDHGQVRGDEMHDWWGVDGRKWQIMKEELVKSDPALAELHDVVDELDDHTQMAAVEWIVTMRAGLAEQRAAADSILTVRYEELVSTQQIVLQSVLDFCELPAQAAPLEYGNRALRPRPPYPRFALHPALRAAFERTSIDLGYA
jgi:hypothetical protein